jgi:hypothetical protein
VIQDTGGITAGTGGALTKIGTGTLTFQGGATNNYIADTVNLSLVSGSIINLNFSGAPDKIRSLTVNGVGQAPGIYGSAASGAPNQLPEFAGTGTVQVTMLAGSRKIQSAVPFDVGLPLAGPSGVECRSGGTTNDYQVVITFFNAVTFTNAMVTSGTGSVSSSSGSGTTTLTVNLTGVTTAQIITITLFGVIDGASTYDVGIPMGVLVGDVTGNRSVTNTDVGQVKGKVNPAAPITVFNYREDVTVNSSVTNSDVGATKAQVGKFIP